MRKYFLAVCCLIVWWQNVYAEDVTFEDLRSKIESIFENVDKEQIHTGLLEEYGFYIVPPMIHTGTVSDSNYISRMGWEMLYAGLYDSRINNKCQMQTPDEVYRQTEGKIGIIYYRYNTFAEDALEGGLITFENEKIQMVSGKPLPYVEKECFAVMPTDGYLPSVFDKSNLFTNTGLDVTKVEYKIGNGDYSVI